jgi:hypothetical protein
MEQTADVQEPNKMTTVEAGKQGGPKPSRFFSIGTLVLAIVNIAIGVIVDISLEFDSEFSSFWTQVLVGLFVVVSVFTLRSRGMVSFLLNVGIFVYLYIIHVAPLLFGTR